MAAIFIYVLIPLVASGESPSVSATYVNPVQGDAGGALRVLRRF